MKFLCSVLFGHCVFATHWTFQDIFTSKLESFNVNENFTSANTVESSFRGYSNTSTVATTVSHKTITLMTKSRTDHQLIQGAAIYEIKNMNNFIASGGVIINIPETLNTPFFFISVWGNTSQERLLQCLNLIASIPFVEGKYIWRSQISSKILEGKFEKDCSFMCSIMNKTIPNIPSLRVYPVMEHSLIDINERHSNLGPFSALPLEIIYQLCRDDLAVYLDMADLFVGVDGKGFFEEKLLEYHETELYKNVQTIEEVSKMRPLIRRFARRKFYLSRKQKGPFLIDSMASYLAKLCTRDPKTYLVRRTLLEGLLSSSNALAAVAAMNFSDKLYNLFLFLEASTLAGRTDILRYLFIVYPMLSRFYTHLMLVSFEIDSSGGLSHRIRDIYDDSKNADPVIWQINAPKIANLIKKLIEKVDNDHVYYEDIDYVINVNSSDAYAACIALYRTASLDDYINSINGKNKKDTVLKLFFQLLAAGRYQDMLDLRHKYASFFDQNYADVFNLYESFVEIAIIRGHEKVVLDFFWSSEFNKPNDYFFNMTNLNATELLYRSICDEEIDLIKMFLSVDESSVHYFSFDFNWFSDFIRCSLYSAEVLRTLFEIDESGRLKHGTLSGNIDEDINTAIASSDLSYLEFEFTKFLLTTKDQYKPKFLIDTFTHSYKILKTLALEEDCDLIEEVTCNRFYKWNISPIYSKLVQMAIRKNLFKSFNYLVNKMFVKQMEPWNNVNIKWVNLFKVANSTEMIDKIIEKALLHDPQLRSLCNTIKTDLPFIRLLFVKDEFLGAPRFVSKFALHPTVRDAVIDALIEVNHPQEIKYASLHETKCSISKRLFSQMDVSSRRKVLKLYCKLLEKYENASAFYLDKNGYVSVLKGNVWLFSKKLYEVPEKKVESKSSIRRKKMPINKK